jgi:hypothetical protein
MFEIHERHFSSCISPFHQIMHPKNKAAEDDFNEVKKRRTEKSFTSVKQRRKKGGMQPSNSLGDGLSKPRKWRLRQMSESDSSIRDDASHHLDGNQIHSSIRDDVPYRLDGNQSQSYNCSINSFDLTYGLPPWEQSNSSTPAEEQTLQASSDRIDSAVASIYPPRSTIGATPNYIHDDSAAHSSWEENDTEREFQIDRHCLPSSREACCERSNAYVSSSTGSSTTLLCVREIDAIHRRARRKDGLIQNTSYSRATPFRRPLRPSSTSLESSMNSSMRLCDVFDDGDSCGDINEDELAISAQEEELVQFALELSKRDVGAQDSESYPSQMFCGSTSYMPATLPCRAGNRSSSYDNDSPGCDSHFSAREEELLRKALEASELDFVHQNSTPCPSISQSRSNPNGRNSGKSEHGVIELLTEEEMIKLAMERSLKDEKIHCSGASLDHIHSKNLYGDSTCDSQTVVPTVDTKALCFHGDRKPSPGRSDARKTSGIARRSYKPPQRYCSSASPSPSMAELEVLLRQEQEELEYVLELSLQQSEDS